MGQMLHRQSAGHPLGCDCCRLHTDSRPGFDIVWPLYCFLARLDRVMESFAGIISMPPEGGRDGWGRSNPNARERTVMRPVDNVLQGLRGLF